MTKGIIKLVIRRTIDFYVNHPTKIDELIEAADAAAVAFLKDYVKQKHAQQAAEAAEALHPVLPAKRTN